MLNHPALERMERTDPSYLDELPDQGLGVGAPYDPLPSDLCWGAGTLWLLHVPVDRTGTTLVTPVELSQAVLFSRFLPMGLYAQLSFAEWDYRTIVDLKDRFLYHELSGGSDPLGDHASRSIWRVALHPDRAGFFDLTQVFREDERHTGQSQFSRPTEGVEKVAAIARERSAEFADKSFAFFFATNLLRRIDAILVPAGESTLSSGRL